MGFYFYNEIVLEDDRVKLEPMSSIHLKELNQITLNNPDLLKFPPSNFGTEVLLKEYFKRALAQRFDQVRYPFVIFDKKSKRYVGSTSLGHYCPNYKQIEIGWTWIGMEFQRTGVNRHCKYLLLKYIFENIKCERVQLRTDESNFISQAAIRAIGGKYEGEIKKIITLPDGHHRKRIYYSILKREWADLKENIFKRQITEEIKHSITDN